MTVLFIVHFNLGFTIAYNAITEEDSGKKKGKSLFGDLPFF